MFMKLRDLQKMNTMNDGTRTLFESIAIPEVEQALNDWNKNFQGPCILIGGAATGYYSRPRATTDIDILFLSKNDIPAQVNGFKRIRPGAFQHNRTHVEIEVIAPDTINISSNLVNKVFETSVESNGVRIASPSGLVALKLQRMARYDEGDIWGLIETGKVDLTGWPLTQQQQEVYQTILNKVNQN